MKKAENEKQKNYSFKKAHLMLFISIILCCSITKMDAQQAISFDDHLSSLSETERVHLSELAFNEQTTAYVTSSGINVAGAGVALLLEVNAADFSTINFTDASLVHVELMRIRVNSNEELSLLYNFSGASGLSDLRCVLVLTNVEATANQLDNMVQGLPSQIAKCYSISIPN